MMMQLEYFKLLPLLALIIFVVPKAAKSYVAAVVGLIGVGVAITGAGAAIAGVVMPFVPKFEPISAVFVFAVGIVSAGCLIYTIGYLKECPKKAIEINIHLFALVTLVYSMMFVLEAKTKFDFLLFWELMTLASFVLVMFNAKSKKILHAAVGYLIVMHIAFFAILFAMTYYGGEALFGYGTMPIWIWCIFMVGFGMKAGLFPLHVWMPVIYPVAPSHISAIMAGGMLNMGVYGIVRITMGVQDLLSVGYILFALGVVSAVYGIVNASIQGDLKKLFAYSSIENVGIMCIGFGLGAIGKASANMPMALIGTGGAILHMLNHSGYKSALFMASGALAKKIGTSDMNKMGGLFKKMPFTGWMFLIAVLGICAIPPFSGFFSEFMLFSGMFEAVAMGNQTIIVIIGIVTLALVGGLTILSFCKAFGVAMLGKPRSQQAIEANEVNWQMVAGYVLPVVCVIGGGVVFPLVVLPRAVDIFNVNAEVMPIVDRYVMMFVVAMAVLALAAMLVGVKKILQKNRSVKKQPTWGCGFENANHNVQYGAHSCSAEIETAVINAKIDKLVEDNVIYPQKGEFDKTQIDKTTNAFNHVLTNLLRKWTARLALFQTGKVNHYILHALVFILLVLALSIISLL